MQKFSEVSTEFPPYEDIEGPRTKSEWIPLNKRNKLSFLHIVAICCSMLGFQIAYSVEFALGTPIMTDLGVPSKYTSVIWLVGPLSGFFVQPLIGYASDGCHAKLGRRRPYIIGGGIGIIAGLLVIFFVKDIGKMLSSSNPSGASIAIFIIALLEFNICINVLQGPSRALLGDVIPPGQQVFANAIASLMLGLAAILTNLIGGLNLVQYTALKDYQLIFVVGMVLIAFSVILTSFAAKEEQFTETLNRKNPFAELWYAVRNLPPEVARISIVYFFSWMAYFPFNVEVTDFVGRDCYHSTPGNVEYNNGVNFGMLITAASNALNLIYSPAQDSFINCVGMKTAYGISQVLEAVCLFPLFFQGVTDKQWVVFALSIPLGVANTVFNSVPYAVLGLSVPKDKIGTFMGALNSCCVLGQQLSNFICISGIGSINALNGRKGPCIASGSIFAIIATIACPFIIVPNGGQASVNEPLVQGE